MALAIKDALSARLRQHRPLRNATFDTEPALAGRRASVLVPLVLRPRSASPRLNGGAAPSDDGDRLGVWVLLTRRSSSLSSHAGEVALPGGRRAGRWPARPASVLTL